MSKNIGKLFLIRDKAVSKNDEKLFLSTQVNEIKESLSSGYLSVDKMETEIIAIDSDADSKLAKVAVVKETYFVKGKKSHSGFLIYHLVHTIKGWKIYKIVY